MVTCTRCREDLIKVELAWKDEKVVTEYCVNCFYISDFSKSLEWNLVDFGYKIFKPGKEVLDF